MKTKRKQPSHERAAHPKKQARQPFLEHAHELRRRLYFIAAAVMVAAAAVYTVQQQAVNLLLKPAHGQNFIYTSPGGGIDFLFRVCIYSGLVLATPVIVYNALEFLSPLMSRESRRFIAWVTAACSLFAAAGVAFGYFIGLPAALHFLFHQFTTAQIKPLVTIQSYLSFVIAYMLGSALLFQLPLILITINRIKPLSPRRLFHYERWVILAAFVLAGLMNPTPNILSQLIVAGPFIVMYQAGIGLIALINRPRAKHDHYQFGLAHLKVPVEENTPQVPEPLLQLAVEPEPIQAPEPEQPNLPIPLIETMRHPPMPRPRQRYMDFIPPNSMT